MTPATAEAPETTPTREDPAEALLREFAVTPGEERHGVTALRAVGPLRFEIRKADDDGDLGLLYGHFAVFNRWTEIHSIFEGRFMEQIAPGAFTKTFSENLKGMRCLFQHGRDPQIGMKPLGPIRSVAEDGTGAAYEVPLSDTSYNRDLLPGLKDGLYGASFRFQVLREEVNTDPGRTDHNPMGIEERTIVECRVREFGPVTFGAYEEATSGIRGITDEYLLEIQREVGADLLVARAVEFNLRSREEVPPAEPQATTSPETERSEGDAGAAETTGEAESRESEGATPPTAPDGSAEPFTGDDRLRTTRLPGTAQPLRTSQSQENPSWKL